jgi:DNA repair exonuclease SbcCD nuclease subunit
MKYVIIGDTHLGVSKSSDIFHNYFEKSFNFLFNYIDQDPDIKSIVQTGDLFDYRREVHFNTLHKSKQYFFDKIQERNLKLFVISGNHDSLFKNTNKINSVRLIVGNQATVVDMHPETHNIVGADVDLYPWINTENFEECKKFAEQSTSETAIGHFEFAHFPLHPGTMAESGLNHTIFKNYKTVFSGHYHTQSKRDNIVYTGTPYELTWVDYNDPKGFWIYDTITDTYEFIKNPHNIFEKIDYVDKTASTYNFTDATDKYVKIVVNDKVSQKKFDEFILNIWVAKPHDVKVIEASVIEAVAEAVGTKVDMVSTQSIIESVIDALDTPLDLSILKQKVLAKYQEALAITNSL